ncbi:MAG TPA: 3-deoxy-D-manno-octulosonic acid transferase [Terriglobales bacterium]|nr:3-deoxy-D-manno-octulosonic acid transferase [Terriglobales bacterium]
MYLLYSALLAVALFLSLPYWILQMLRHGKYREGFAERFGRLPQHIRALQNGPTIWVHAVSVGEVLAISGLVTKLQRDYPTHRILVSTTTSSGQKLAQKFFHPENVFYFPLDFTFAIRPYLQKLRPALIVIAETEFWPNFLRLARASGARIAIVNARISDHSWPGYRRFRRILKPVLQNVDIFLCQAQQDRLRLIDVGAPPDRIAVTGNLKFDVPPPAPPPVIASLQNAFQHAGAGPILVCGSTVQDEEQLLLQAFQNILASHPRAVMILAPRHPERFAEVARLLEDLGIQFWRRSLWNGDPISAGVLLVDSIGELASLYALAHIAFVGGSLVPRGGHNIIEPAQHGVPIVVGNHTENFRDIVGVFQSHDAVKIVGPAELPLVLMELISNPGERRALGQHAIEALRSQMGATERTRKALENILAGRSG